VYECDREVCITRRALAQLGLPKHGKKYTALYFIRKLTTANLVTRGFGGIEVACWPLVPKFAGSHLAEAVGFLRAKKS